MTQSENMTPPDSHEQPSRSMLQRLLGIGGIREQRYEVTLWRTVYYDITTKRDIKINTRNVYAVLKDLGHRPRKVTTTLHREYYDLHEGYIVSKCTLRLKDEGAATDLKEQLETHVARLTMVSVLPLKSR